MTGIMQKKKQINLVLGTNSVELNICFKHYFVGHEFLCCICGFGSVVLLTKDCLQFRKFSDMLLLSKWLIERITFFIKDTIPKEYTA